MREYTKNSNVWCKHIHVEQLSIQTMVFRFTFSSQLDMAIENYERKKPTDLAPFANSICAPEKQAANCLPLSKIKTDIEIFTALNKSISIVFVVIHKKIDKWVEKVWINKLFVCLINSNYFVSDQHMKIIHFPWKRSWRISSLCVNIKANVWN